MAWLAITLLGHARIEDETLFQPYEKHTGSLGPLKCLRHEHELMDQQIREAPETWALVSYQVASGTGTTPRVELCLRHGAQELRTEMECGDGPIDAIFLAIEKLTGVSVVCKDFQVHSVTVGKDAQAEVTVEVEHQGRTYRGLGVSTDSVEASGRAFLNAINRVAMLQGVAI